MERHFTKKPVTIGLLIEANADIREAAGRRDWHLVNLAYCNYQVPVGIRLDGALTCVLPPQFRAVHDRFRAEGIPVVRLGSLPHPDDHLIPAVVHDFEAAGRKAASFYHEHGFHHVGFLGYSPPGDLDNCYQAFRMQAEVLNMECHEFRFRGRRGESPAAKNRRKQAEQQQWVRQLPKPVGILFSTTRLAAGLCSVVRAGGMLIPTDVAVLAIGENRNVCECTMPTLSAVALDEKRRAEAAMDLLAALMRGDTGPKEAILIPPAQIVERQTTNVLATEDRIVAQALAYMWDRLDSSLSGDHIAGEVGISKRQLERRFRRAIGRGINEELRRKRLEEGKRLLRGTTLPIVDISPLIGFRSATYFHRIFSRAFGLTPREYRTGPR